VARTDLTRIGGAVLLVANLLDGVFTLVLLELRAAEEVNPFLRWLYQSSPVGFMVAKLALIQLAALLLLRHDRFPAARLVLSIAAAFYVGLAVYDAGCLASLSWVAGAAHPLQPPL
jgi:uncharacterized protein DUF5658